MQLLVIFMKFHKKVDKLKFPFSNCNSNGYYGTNDKTNRILEHWINLNIITETHNEFTIKLAFDFDKNDWIIRNRKLKLKKLKNVNKK